MIRSGQTDLLNLELEVSGLLRIDSLHKWTQVCSRLSAERMDRAESQQSLVCRPLRAVPRGAELHSEVFWHLDVTQKHSCNPRAPTFAFTASRSCDSQYSTAQLLSLGLSETRQKPTQRFEWHIHTVMRNKITPLHTITPPALRANECVSALTSSPLWHSALWVVFWMALTNWMTHKVWLEQKGGNEWWGDASGVKGHHHHHHYHQFTMQTMMFFLSVFVSSEHS